MFTAASTPRGTQPRRMWGTSSWTGEVVRWYLILIYISHITYCRRVWVEAEERRKKGRRQEVPAAWDSLDQHVSLHE